MSSFSKNFDKYAIFHVETVCKLCQKAKRTKYAGDSKDLKLDRFVAALKAFTEQDIEHIFNKIPAEWNNEATAKMKTHVLTVLKHQDKFIDSVRRVVV